MRRYLLLIICLLGLYSAEVTASIDPSKIDAKDLDKLLTFMEQADGDGITNAEKMLGSSYSSDWKDNYATWAGEAPFVQWVQDIETQAYYIKGINVYQSPIGNGLSGILDFEDCDSLSSVNCENNNFTELKLANCTQLKYVSASNNQLKSVDLTNCESLENVALYGNQLLFSKIHIPELCNHALNGQQDLKYYASIATGKIIVDLSSELASVDNIYWYIVGSDETPESYSPSNVSGGKYTFDAALIDQRLYCEMRLDGLDFYVKCEIMTGGTLLSVSIEGFSHDPTDIDLVLYHADGTPTDLKPEFEVVYGFDNVAPGKYLLDAKAPGYLQTYYHKEGINVSNWANATLIEVSPFAGFQQVTLTLTPEQALTGDVTIRGNIADANAIIKAQVSRNATVGVYKSSPAKSMLKSDELKLIRTTIPDEAGDYLFTGLPAGRYFVRAEIAGYTPESGEINALAGREYAYNFFVDETSHTIRSEQVMSAPQLEETKMAIYPNPATDIVRIAGLEGNYTIRFINMLGQVVKTVTGQSAEAVINISNQPAGMYLVRIESGGKSINRKLIRK